MNYLYFIFSMVNNFDSLFNIYFIMNFYMNIYNKNNFIKIKKLKKILFWNDTNLFNLFESFDPSMYYISKIQLNIYYFINNYFL